MKRSPIRVETTSGTASPPKIKISSHPLEIGAFPYRFTATLANGVTVEINIPASALGGPGAYKQAIDLVHEAAAIIAKATID